MTEREALKLALEALETLHDENMDYLTRNKLGGENNQCMVFAREAITAIKEALAQQGRVTYAGNGTSGFSEGERPTGFFLQITPQPEEKLITIVDIEKIVKFKERNA